MPGRVVRRLLRGLRASSVWQMIEAQAEKSRLAAEKRELELKAAHEQAKLKQQHEVCISPHPRGVGGSRTVTCTFCFALLSRRK